MWLTPVSLRRWLLPFLRAASPSCLTLSAAKRRCCSPFAPLTPFARSSGGAWGRGRSWLPFGLLSVGIGQLAVACLQSLPLRV